MNIPFSGKHNDFQAFTDHLTEIEKAQVITFNPEVDVCQVALWR